jgi:hypothetical protein
VEVENKEERLVEVLLGVKFFDSGSVELFNRSAILVDQTQIFDDKADDVV